MGFMVGEHFENFIREQVRAGRFNNANEVVCEGLRLMEERETKLAALREHVARALASDKTYTDAELEAILQNDSIP